MIHVVLIVSFDNVSMVSQDIEGKPRARSDPHAYGSQLFFDPMANAANVTDRTLQKAKMAMHSS